ncbi:MAG: hypothetical protein ICV77_04020 [Cyanobacteria bacterium Co-bin8]|nr:hypothetical protein [Cyanobacteria bacterium Co-bin8]
MGIAKSKFTYREKQRLINRLLIDGVIDETFLDQVLLCEDICARLDRCRERREHNLFEYIKALEAPGKAVLEPIRDKDRLMESRLCEKHGAVVTQVLSADPFTADKDLTILFSYEGVSADSKSWRELKLHFILTNKDGDIVEALVKEVRSLMELIKTIHSIDSIEETG